LSRVIRAAGLNDGHSSTPYSLNDIETSARTLLDSAREDAKAIVDEAKAEAARLLENLCSETEEDARKRGYEAGFEEGKKAVFENHMSEYQEDIEALSSALRHIRSSLEDGKRRLEKAAERDLVTLALAVAKKVIDHEVSVTPEVAANVARRAVGLLGERETVELLLNPDDIKLIEAYLPELRKEFADLREVQLTPVNSVPRGGCVARTEVGTVDARIESQIDQIAKELLEDIR